MDRELALKIASEMIVAEETRHGEATSRGIGLAYYEGASEAYREVLLMCFTSSQIDEMVAEINNNVKGAI